MAIIERLAILIDANSQGASREFRKLSGEAKTTDTQLTKTQKAGSLAAGAFKTMGVVAGGAAVAGLARLADSSIDAASNLEEVRQKSEQIFGGEFGRIEQFAEGAADALGLSTRAAFEFASGFGNLFASAGFAEDETARLSQSLTQLAGDLASFNNISVDEAFGKLRSGLSGEAEPLRQVGVFLSAAKVEAEAYESGIAEVGSTLTEAQKIQARYNIILEETAQAQGDVARTSESLANQERRLAATAEDAQARIGASLAPAKAEALNTLADLISGLSQFEDEAQRVTSQSIGATLRDSLLAPLNVRSDFDAVVDAFRGVGDAAVDAVPPTDDFAAASRKLVDQLKPAASAASDAVGPTHSLAAEFAYTGETADDAEAAVKALQDAIESMRSPVLDVRDANRGFQDALDGVTDALDENGRTLDRTTEKGRANEAALDAVAEAAFDTLDAYARNGAEAGQLANKTQKLRDDLVRAAERFGLTKAEARRYADQLGLIPGDVTTNVRLAGVDAAIAQAEKLKEVTTGLSVGQLTSVVRQDEAMANRGRASGGPVGPGRYLVGERGPELLDLTGGIGRVYSNAQTKPMTRGGLGNVTVNVNNPRDAASTRVSVLDALAEAAYRQGAVR